MNQVYTFVLDIFRYHKKKIGFLVASIAFWFVVLFPYDDLSDFVTLKVTQATQSNVYLQFNGLSFGFLPQLGIKMNEVLVESVYAPTLSMKTLGFAPKLSNIFGSPGGIVKAYGLFGGDASIDFGPSNELDVEGEEVGVEVNLEEVALKDLSKFLKKSYNFPLSVQGTTNISSKMNIDPTFKVQPKGRIDIKIKQLNIPSSNLPLPMGAVTMSMPLPALKLTDVVIEGSLNDGKLFIKEGTIGSGEKNDDLYGKVTGDVFFQMAPGGRFKPGGYDLKINLNISENLKRQLNTILLFVDSVQGIGNKYKFDSLKGVRYSMRLSGRNFKEEPRVLPY